MLIWLFLIICLKKYVLKCIQNTRIYFVFYFVYILYIVIFDILQIVSSHRP